MEVDSITAQKTNYTLYGINPKRIKTKKGLKQKTPYCWFFNLYRSCYEKSWKVCKKHETAPGKISGEQELTELIRKTIRYET